MHRIQSKGIAMSERNSKQLEEQQLDQIIGGALINPVEFQNFYDTRMEVYKKDAESKGYALDYQACYIKIAGDYEDYLDKFPVGSKP
jgi:hypothetical protein